MICLTYFFYIQICKKSCRWKVLCILFVTFIKFAITDLLDKKPYELSGGEKQRTAICRALIYNPDLILADEPTGNLDSASSEVVIHTLEEINKKMGKTILLVTHDPIIASSCDRIIFLKDGKVKEDLKRTGDKEQFYNEIITNWC